MKASTKLRLFAVCAALMGLGLLALPIRALMAQQVLPPDGRPTGMACAYNTSPPTASGSGQIIWAQCDSTGHLLTVGTGGGGSSNVTIVGPVAGSGSVKTLDDNSAAILSAVTGSIPAGTNVIGHVITDTGSTTAVSSLPALGAGSNIIGNVRIDQTTPGTTNGVVINSAALPTGAATSANQPTNAAQGSTTSGQTGNLHLGAVTTAAPTYTTAQTSPLSLTTAGGLRQDLASVAGTSAVSLMVAPSTAPVTATNPALTVDLRPDSPGIITLGPAAVSGAVPFVLSSQYPVNAVTTTPQAVTATATGTTAATVATIPAVANKTAYICGFTITADATALAVGTAVVSGTISGSLSYLQGISAVTSGAGNLTQSFNPCIPASAANTAIVVTSAAAGTGGNTIVNAQGYYL